jgi:hypothetical protein
MAKKKKAAAKKGGGAKAKGKAKTNPILSLGVPRFGCALVPCMRASLSFPLLLSSRLRAAGGGTGSSPDCARGAAGRRRAGDRRLAAGLGSSRGRPGLLLGGKRWLRIGCAAPLQPPLPSSLPPGADGDPLALLLLLRGLQT